MLIIYRRLGGVWTFGKDHSRHFMVWTVCTVLMQLPFFLMCRLVAPVGRDHSWQCQQAQPYKIQVHLFLAAQSSAEPGASCRIESPLGRACELDANFVQHFQRLVYIREVLGLLPSGHYNTKNGTSIFQWAPLIDFGNLAWPAALKKMLNACLVQKESTAANYPATTVCKY